MFKLLILFFYATNTISIFDTKKGRGPLRLHEDLAVTVIKAFRTRIVLSFSHIFYRTILNNLLNYIKVSSLLATTVITLTIVSFIKKSSSLIATLNIEKIPIHFTPPPVSCVANESLEASCNSRKRISASSTWFTVSSR